MLIARLYYILYRGYGEVVIMLGSYPEVAVQIGYPQPLVEVYMFQLLGYDYNYSIDKTGQVYKGNRPMKAQDNGIGYMNIQLLKNGKRKHHYIHRLV